MNQQFNVDQIMFAQETLKETASTVSAMKDANKSLKKQFKQINISKVEDLQDDMSDLLEQAEEVQNALSRSYATDDVDEADLEVQRTYKAHWRVALRQPSASIDENSW